MNDGGGNPPPPTRGGVSGDYSLIAQIQVYTKNLLFPLYADTRQLSEISYPLLYADKRYITKFSTFVFLNIYGGGILVQNRPGGGFIYTG